MRWLVWRVLPFVSEAAVSGFFWTSTAWGHFVQAAHTPLGSEAFHYWFGITT